SDKKSGNVSSDTFPAAFLRACLQLAQSHIDGKLLIATINFYRDVITRIFGCQHIGKRRHIIDGRVINLDNDIARLQTSSLRRSPVDVISDQDTMIDGEIVLRG